jgi:hypothetical protein
MRKGYTLVEALTSIFVLAIGLLALTAIILAGIINIQHTARTLAVQECFDNAASILRISGTTAKQPFSWVYEKGKAPYLPQDNVLRVPLLANTEFRPLAPELSLSLDVQGPYGRYTGVYTNPLTGQSDRRPFFTGRRGPLLDLINWQYGPPDPPLYTFALSVRPVVHSIPNPAPPPPSKPQPDTTLADVSVVIFEGYYEDPSDPEAPTAYVLDNAALDYQAITLRPVDPTRPITAPPPRRVPTRAIIVDGENGYVYRLVQGEVIPPGRALPTSQNQNQNQNQNQKIIVLERAVEVLELGIIAVR